MKRGGFITHTLVRDVLRLFIVFILGVLVPLCFFGAYHFIFADTGNIRPNADGTVTSTAVGCGGGGRYDCLNEVVTTADTPNTGTDYAQFALDNIDNYQMETISDVATVSQVQVHLFHNQLSTNLRFRISLWDATETTQYGTSQNITYRSSAQWDTATIPSLSLTQAQLDGLRVRLHCYRDGGGQPQTCRAYALYATVTYDRLIEVTVSQTGTQQNVGIGTTDQYIGGAFVITENVSSRNITSITLTENGTVNAATNLSNIEIWYDIDDTAPYNCASESFNGDEIQFGSTSSGGFSGADGTLTFTGSAAISTVGAMCAYVVLDVGSGATAAETIEVQIANPSTQVVGSGSADVTPATAVSLSGTTVLVAPRLDQMHYHWRNDDGAENAATSATGGVDDTPNNALGKLNPTRLRLAISNEGNATSNATQYRLEYAQKVTTCSVASGWTDVGAGGGDWDMFDSTFLTEGGNTTDIAEAIGGVANENTTFLTPNGGVRDTTSQTGNITLTSTEFVELEYSVVATSNSTEGYTYCFRVTNAGTPINTYSIYPEATILADVTVTTDGSQPATVEIPTNNVQMGGRFIITDNIAGNTSVTSITIAASGTVDFVNDLDNIELWYDLDTSDPYNCASESFNGNELQFGATDTNGFSIAGLSTFTGSVTVNPTQTMCIYVVLDVGAGTDNDGTLDISVLNASTDVTIDSGTVAPAALVSFAGMTTFVLTSVQQLHYHWRNDDGSETGATSATGGIEDTTRENLRQGVPQRLRIGISNEGSLTTSAYQYRLEYAVRTSVCSAASGWTQVGSGSDPAFVMFNSTNITDGGNTTNIAVGQGGVTDEATTYLSSNGALKDTSSQTGSITLPGNHFVDLEYSIQATASSTEGATYCFRVTNAGTPIDVYVEYPKVLIKPQTDFYIQRGVTTITGTSATINAGTQYVAPSAASRAFIRITNTNNTGAGSTGSTGNADDVTAYISNPNNITSNITFTRPAAATGNTVVAWEIIEYTGASGGNNEIVVRSQSSATYGGANTTVTTGTVSGIVDDAQVVVFITGQLNPDTTTNYPYGLSTAAWNGGSDTATFTRGASNNAAIVSYAVVEFVGNNWKVQRVEHTYTAANSTETESITAVNSLSRAFVHVQKRMGSGLNNHADFGHRVWLSSIGQVSFELETGAGTPANHRSVAWVIENTQTVGDTMIVSRSNGTQSAGSSPTVLNTNIGATISDPQDASLFFNNSGNEAGSGGGQNSFPEPMMSGRIISTTQYELWIATPDNDSRTWRTEVVEWPTAARDIAQNYYMFYENEDSIDPSTPWTGALGPIGENTEVTVLDNPIESGEVMRLRMTAVISSAAMAPNIDTFKLQYAERTTVCPAIGEVNWHDVGNIGDSTALWRGYNNPTPADGSNLSTDPPAGGALKISIADVAGTYEEENPSAVTPFEVIPGENVEFDWVVQNHLALEKTDYCFRMVEANGKLLEDYYHYPVMRTAGYTPTLNVWRFYEDESNITPTTPLASEGVSPIDIEFLNAIKLRTTVKESTGGTGRDIKFKLQFSEYSDFSQLVFDVVGTSSCTQLSLWCYADGAGVDNAGIVAAVLSDADACTGGVGVGCGTHNEGSATTSATYDHPAYATVEYEFTIMHSGARANAVYYFRLYDMVNDMVVPASTTLPSVVTEGAQLVFNVNGLPAGTVTEGETIDVSSTPGSIIYGTIPFDEEYTAAYRLQVDTNATEGYQIFMYSDQPLTNTYGATIEPITGSNITPVSWSVGCDDEATSCFGYHAGDDSLEAGSSRFAPNDSYAPLNTLPEEVMFSSIAQDSAHDIVYKLQVREDQPAGDYETTISFLAIPIF